MVNKLKLSRKEKEEKLDKKAIIARHICNAFNDKEVMFAYFSGSIAYDAYIEQKSDIDITVFLENYDDFIHINLAGYDLFVYGKKYLDTRQDLSNNLPEYNRIFIDDKLKLDDTLIYLNPKYSKEYEEFKKNNVKDHLKEMLINLYKYFMFLYVDSSLLGKRFYHVIRVRGQIEHYKKTGIYDLTIDDNYKKEMLEFKLNYDKDDTRVFYMDLIGRYLEEIREFLEELE